MNLEIASLQKELAEGKTGVNSKEIEKRISFQNPEEPETSFYIEKEVPVVATVEEESVVVSNGNLELILKEFRKKFEENYKE